MSICWHELAESLKDFHGNRSYMREYKFSGEIKLGRETQPFTREVEAESEKHAEDKVYAELGSKHSVPRSSIEIEGSEEVE